MTREDVIKGLTFLANTCESDKDSEIFNMAIKALDQDADKEKMIEELEESLQKANATNTTLIKLLEGKRKPCEDAVSKKDMYFKLTNGAYPNETIEQFIDRLVKELEAIPPVTPTRKKGKPILDVDSQDWSFDKPLKCPFCNKRFDWDIHYCSNCGAEMESKDGN